MARRVGAELSPALVDRLSQRDLSQMLGRAIPLITVDAAGRPHPMLCSYLELLAVDPRTIRVAINAPSGSATNLAARGAATLLLVERRLTVYVKCRAAGPPRAFGSLARFDLVVEDVLEDVATEAEGDAAITGGITYAPAPGMDSELVRETMRVLRA
jgi:hypothetical protein